LGQYPQIVAEFDFRILPTSLSRADGFGFVLLNTLVFGKTGAGPQITELPSLSKSFGVGFDIFKNAGEPSNNHIRLTFDGAQVADVNINQQTLDLADGLFHHATILLDFLQNGTNLTVTLDTSVTPISKHFIQGMRSYESRVAFGARTGGEFAHHDLDNIKVSFIKQTLLPFHRGDSDNNGQLQLTDAVRILGYLFLGQTAPTCLDAADADGNNQLQLTDAVRILGYLFLGQAAPAAPGPPPSPCGTDNDDTHVGCDAYTNC
jgi:hypothetical protein